MRQYPMRAHRAPSLMLDTFSQIAIFLFGITSIFLLGRKNKWGMVAGLAAQPFWFITTYLHEQWWLFLVTILYTGVWISGIRTWFAVKDAAP